MRVPVTVSRPIRPQPLAGTAPKTSRVRTSRAHAVPGDVVASADVYDSPVAEARPTPLQRHAAFFDRNGDGKITLAETYQGCRALGFGRLVSGTLAWVINTGLGWPTSNSWWPTLEIDIANIQRGKHGSDTDIYDLNGNFDAAKFDAMFARYDGDGDGRLNKRELLARARGDRDLLDVVGQIASLGEFGLIYWLAAERGGIPKDALRKVYDGTLFYELERTRARHRVR